MIAHVTKLFLAMILQIDVTQEKLEAIMIIEIVKRSCEAAIDDIRKILIFIISFFQIGVHMFIQ